MVELRSSPEFLRLQDGEALFRRLDREGFGDLCYAPTEAGWAALRRSKLPDLAAPLTHRVALDTLYSLLADADIETSQEEIDAEMANRIGGR